MHVCANFAPAITPKMPFSSESKPIIYPFTIDKKQS